MERHSRKLVRKQDQDYSWHGSYFVTICTKDSKRLFGNIVNGKMVLSNLGIIAKDFWEQIPKHFNNVELDEFVVMPDHIHGIIVLLPDSKFDDLSNGITPVGTNHGLSLQVKRMNQRLPNIIKQYKSSVSRESKQKNIWQRSYHDRIIRNNFELEQIRKYIFHNPLAWEEKITQNKPTHKSNFNNNLNF